MSFMYAPDLPRQYAVSFDPPTYRVLIIGHEEPGNKARNNTYSRRGTRSSVSLPALGRSQLPGPHPSDPEVVPGREPLPETPPRIHPTEPEPRCGMPPNSTEIRRAVVPPSRVNLMAGGGAATPGRTRSGIVRPRVPSRNRIRPKRISAAYFFLIERFLGAGVA